MLDFTLQLSDPQLYNAHWNITYVMVFAWIFISVLGFQAGESLKYKITLILVLLSFFQEVFDYYNRFFLSELYIVKIQTDLPLHLCHFAYWFSVLGMLAQVYNYKNKQFFFNCAYFLGFSGAFQGIVTVDLTGIFTFGDMLSLHLQHSLIILNVLWLIFAYGMKFNLKGVMQAFLFTNILLIFVGIINTVIESNYMFLCKPPDVNNPFLIGDWPFYLIILELIFFIYGYFLCLPFLVMKFFKK